MNIAEGIFLGLLLTFLLIACGGMVSLLWEELQDFFRYCKENSFLITGITVAFVSVWALFAVLLIVLS